MAKIKEIEVKKKGAIKRELADKTIIVNLDSGQVQIIREKEGSKSVFVTYLDAEGKFQDDEDMWWKVEE